MHLEIAIAPKSRSLRDTFGTHLRCCRFGRYEKPRLGGAFPQGRQDSNLQPPVLETGALPIELRPSAVRGTDCTAAVSGTRAVSEPEQDERAKPGEGELLEGQEGKAMARIKARTTSRSPASNSSRPVGQRRALGALFFVLALAFAGVAATSADAARHQLRLTVVAFAAAALALWLGGLAVRSWRAR